MPNLASFYIKAHEEIFNVRVFVPESKYGIFRVTEDDLREHGIWPMEYAYTVVRVLKSWAKSKSMSKIPINVFCGKFALDKFRKINESETVDVIVKNVDNIEEELLHNELIVARLFIQHNANCDYPIRIPDVVKQLKPMLGKHWLEAYHLGTRPISDAIDVLCEEYKLSYAKDYYDIAMKIRKRQPCQRHIHTIVHSG